MRVGGGNGAAPDPRRFGRPLHVAAMSLSSQQQQPFLDEHGLLRLDGRWVAISDAQLPVMRLLLDRFGRVVTIDTLMAAVASVGGTASKTSVFSLVRRLKRKVTELGLRIHTVRGRGFMLTAEGRG